MIELSLNKPSPQSLEELFAENIKKFNYVSKFVVAVSGGADSMAIVLLANDWARENNKEIVAVTVDHGLRAGSKNEAEKVSKWLANKNIKHTILMWEGDKPESNIQANARDARYRLLTEFCKNEDVDALFVAHNKQDQAETILLRIMRGSGVDGLSAIAEETEINQVKIVRPLLFANKQDLRGFLQRNNQEWIEDPSNKNEKYDRIVVRNFIERSKEPDLLVARLADTATNMARSRAYIEQKVAEEFEQIVDIRGEEAYVDHAGFCALHEESAYRILSQIITKIGGKYYKPRFEKLKSLYKKIVQNKLGSGTTLGGCEVKCGGKKVVIIQELLR